jgi:3-polyprenyl-4-hydroxybenzoate decarboxylase
MPLAGRSAEAVLSARRSIIILPREAVLGVLTLRVLTSASPLLLVLAGAR